MYLSSSNASSFLNNFYYDFCFKSKFSNEIKERTFNFIYSFINDLNNSISGIEYINLINKYFIFEETKIIKIKDSFFKEQKKLYLNSLNPIWYKETKKKKVNIKDKQLITLFIFNEISKFDLTFFFNQIFSSNDTLYICTPDLKSQTIDHGYIKNKIKLNSSFFTKTKKIKPYYQNYIKHRTFDQDEFNQTKKEIVDFLEDLLNKSNIFLYNRGRIKLTEEIENELLKKKIISEDFLFNKKEIIVDHLNRFKLLMHPRNFIKYDFEAYELNSVKQSLKGRIEIIDFIKEIKIPS